MLLWPLTSSWKANKQRWLSRSTRLLSPLLTLSQKRKDELLLGTHRRETVSPNDLGAQAWAADLQLVFIFYLAALGSFSV